MSSTAREFPCAFPGKRQRAHDGRGLYAGAPGERALSGAPEARGPADLSAVPSGLFAEFASAPFVPYFASSESFLRYFSAV